MIYSSGCRLNRGRVLVSCRSMSDIRESMREFRFLEEKRKLAPLTQVEEQRWLELGRTLGIFDLAEANPDDIAEVDPDDVVLIQPGPAQPDSVQATGPAANVQSAQQPVSAAQDARPLAGFESVEQRPPQDSKPRESEVSLAPDATRWPDRAPSDGAAAQSETAPPAMGEHGERASQTPAPAVVSASDEGTNWNGLEAAESKSPVIDLSASDATPGRGSAIATAPTEMPSSDASGPVDASAVDGAPAQPAAAEPTNDMPEPWGGDAAAHAFPTTPPQFRIDASPPSAPVLEGERRVVVHLLDGQVRRGSVRDLDVSASTLPLASARGVEHIPVDRLTAIFFMLPPGSGKPQAQGQKIRLTFQDGRQVVGFSPDYQTGDPGFFLVPADLKTNTECIFVYRWSVYSIAEE